MAGSTDKDRPKLPIWYRSWLILPFAFVLLVFLGNWLTIPPRLIDPRQYPAFMDGGDDWGGSNIFFFTRVVVLFMGALGFLSLRFLSPKPDWTKESYRLPLFLLSPHIASFAVLALFLIVTCGDYSRDTWFVLYLEISVWYLLTGKFAVDLLKRGVGNIFLYLTMGAASMLFLVWGFYCGFWLAGPELNAHELGLSRLMIRFVIQMSVFFSGTRLLTRLIKKEDT